MAIIITSDKYYKELAEKNRNVFGTTIEYKPSEISSAISNMQDVLVSYNDITSGAVFAGENTKLIGDRLYSGMFAGSNVKSFEVPENVVEIPNYLFLSSSIESVTLHDNITYLGESCFEECVNLSTIKLPCSLVTICDDAFHHSGLSGNLFIPDTVTTICDGAFYWTMVSSIDVSIGVSNIPKQMAYMCDLLKTLILRNSSSICTLANVDALKYTPIEDGTGYIYVPSALLGSYKTATNWSTYAAQFRALEDYTVDGTVTGEFDFSKI